MPKKKIHNNELIRLIVKRCNGTYLIHEVQDCLEMVFEELEYQMRNGHDIEVRGFGTFSTKFMPSRERMNLKTMKPMMSKEVHKPKFSFSRSIRERFHTMKGEEMNAAKE